MEEARRVIRRLERIESLRGGDAPAAELLAEVRQLLREGEAWLAVEREGAGDGDADGRAVAPDRRMDGAAAALEGCRSTLAAGER